MAAQIFEAARKDLPDFEAEAAAGNFSKLKAWLNKNIHQVEVGAKHACMPAGFA